MPWHGLSGCGLVGRGMVGHGLSERGQVGRDLHGLSLRVTLLDVVWLGLSLEALLSIVKGSSAFSF